MKKNLPLLGMILALCLTAGICLRAGAEARPGAAWASPPAEEIQGEPVYQT
jgi:hypothetical protein